MNTQLPLGLERDVVTEQLFRYAQDLEELMRQHDRLQVHHQMVLESMGQEVHGADLLSQLIKGASSLYWITDATGKIIQVGNQQQGQSAESLVGSDVAQLISPQCHETLYKVLRRVAGSGGRACSVFWQLAFVEHLNAQSSSGWNVMLMPKQQGRDIQIYWILFPSLGNDCRPLEALGSIAHAVDSDYGVIVANAMGTISSVNSGCCLMTGYSENELVNQNPRILSSGRHDEEFYRSFWGELLATGCWRGTLFNRRKGCQLYLQWMTTVVVENELGQPLSFIAAMEDLSHAEHSKKRLAKLAYSDALTGLPNRRMMIESLQAFFADTRGADHALAILFIDLNRFKPINDEFGHEAGDLVLQEVAKRMRAALANGQILARIGGDEFVVLLVGARWVDQAENIAAQLNLALAPSIDFKGRSLSVGASMGCAQYLRDGDDMVTLLKNADAAMYNAKRLGIPFCRYEATLDLCDMPNLESEVLLALERDQIRLMYQPRFGGGAGGALCGCEVVMRWMHPVLGEVDPTRFNALAEQSGANVLLGNWAVEQVCRQMRSWRDQGMPAITVSFHISQRQLQDSNFLHHLECSLNNNKLDPHWLEIELVELRSTARRPEDIEPLRRLTDLGVRLAQGCQASDPVSAETLFSMARNH